MSIMIAPLDYAHQSLALRHGRLEKRRNHLQQPTGAFDKRHTRHAREHRELDIREADDIAGDTSRNISTARSG